MKPAICLMLIIYCSGVCAQRSTGAPSKSIKGIDVTNTQYIDVSGSPFLKQDFTPAYIAFKNGAKYKVTKAFEEVKLNKKSFSSGLVEMGYSKAELEKGSNIDFKNEKDVTNLIRSLNL